MSAFSDARSTAYVSLLLVLALLSSGCAHGYSALQPNTYEYGATTTSNSVTFAYRASILEEGNGGFAKKARKTEAYPVALRITNNREEPIDLSTQSLEVRAGDVPVDLVMPQTVSHQLGQAWGWHVLWSLLVLSISNDGGESYTVLPIGVPIALFNMIRGASANSRLADDFEKKSLFGRTIEPGDTVEGLVFIQGGIGANLEFSYDAND